MYHHLSKITYPRNEQAKNSAYLALKQPSLAHTNIWC